MQNDRFVVITGGPGAGKSTLIEALARKGFATTTEAGRAIIQDQMEIDGPALPWRDEDLFVELMLGWELRSYREAAAHTGPVFFDRGIPDFPGYYIRERQGRIPPYVDRAVRTFRYHRRVFIAPPWPEIYENDTERKQTPEQALEVYESMVKAYPAYGYELVELPRKPVEERIDFVLSWLDHGR